jgi:hypothetical protein
VKRSIMFSWYTSVIRWVSNAVYEGKMKVNVYLVSVGEPGSGFGHVIKQFWSSFSHNQSGLVRRSVPSAKSVSGPSLSRN